MLNAETRTMQTYIECDNSTGHMMPNMYANVNMSLKGQKHIMLDKSAVLQSSKGAVGGIRDPGDRDFLP